ncbi:MAG: sigma-70 family RNA polymerase sigma factor [Candidatus Limnocylindrales bacterium]|nr:sigma-70 family RNA polymerase sigma factor [Candidatus Limnocylindrales bacterium]
MTEGRGAPSDDAGLVRELVRGSEAALATLYDRYGGAIFASAYRLTADRGIAEEVVQETFLTLWNRAELFDPAAGSLPAWLHAIGRNRAVDRLRAAGRRPRLVAMSSSATPDESETLGLERAIANGTVVAVAAQPPGPEEAADAAGVRDAIRTAMTTMPDQERTVILLAYQDELSQTEIADRLDWPLGTVKTRTRRALRRLREALGGEFGPSAELTDVPVATGQDR